MKLFRVGTHFLNLKICTILFVFYNYSEPTENKLWNKQLCTSTAPSKYLLDWLNQIGPLGKSIIYSFLANWLCDSRKLILAHNKRFFPQYLEDGPGLQPIILSFFPTFSSLRNSGCYIMDYTVTVAFPCRQQSHGNVPCFLFPQ